MSDQLVADATYTTHDLHKGRTSIPSGEFEPTTQQVSGPRPSLQNLQLPRSAHSALRQLNSGHKSMPFFSFCLLLVKTFLAIESPQSVLAVPPLCFVQQIQSLFNSTHYSSNACDLLTSQISMSHSSLLPISFPEIIFLTFLMSPCLLFTSCNSDFVIEVI